MALRAVVGALLVCLGLLTQATSASAQRETRVALVVGNGAYQNAEGLRNPTNDARAMAKVLRDAGFDVILRENATRRGLSEALREFSGKLAPGGVGVFYYAGHGIQVRGLNYLIPVDAALSSEDELKYETVDVNDVLSRLDEARTRLSLVILDACRDNPFARRFRSTGRGLAQTDAPRGTVIAYATAPGETAADGDGENGLYTTELLKSIVLPGLKLEEVFKRTIDGVARASGNKQTPWVSSSFRGEFVFNAATAAPPLPPPPAAAPPPASQDAVEQTAWLTIASSNNPAMFELFLKRFPNGVYADFARTRLEELKAAKAGPSPEELRRMAALDEARRKADAEEARRVALEEARRAAQEEARRIAAVEEARRKADADARRTAADEAKRRADAEEAKRKADADAKRAAEEETKRTAAAEEARRRAVAEEEKKSTEGIETALKLADIDRRRIQAALTAKGFDTLGTDGAFGPRTRQMIANWQRSRNEATTGFLTATQAALLSQEGQSALTKIEDERKKADEEKRRVDAERQKAEAERQKASPPQQAAAPTPVTPPPAPVAAPAAAPAAAGIDGTYLGQICRSDQRWCRPLIVVISGGMLTATSRSCQAPVVMSAQVSPNGSFANEYKEASGADTSCVPTKARFSGRIANGRIDGDAGVGMARITWWAKRQ